MNRVGRLAVLGGLLTALAAHPGQAQSLEPGRGPPTAVFSGLAPSIQAPGARDAIARVAQAEAAGQGDSGQAAVVYTILNRLASGLWGQSVDQVVNAKGQFEPVMRAGGDWRALPPAGAAQRARVDTILNLALEGRLPDLTGGALYFQNPRIVAARAKAGAVSPNLVHFGGSAPSAVIGDHAFYAQLAGRRAVAPVDALARAGGGIFVGKAKAAQVAASAPESASGGRGLFVLPDGTIVEERP